MPRQLSSSRLRLSAAYQPSTEEIRAYAMAIAINEGLPPDCAETYVREAELQLWAWRVETHQRPASRHSSRGFGPRRAR